MTNPASSATRKNNDDAGSNEVEGPGIRNTTVQKLYVPFAFLVRSRSACQTVAGTLKFHSTCSFRLGLPAKLRPSETVGTCFLVMYGKESHALIAGLSAPPQPFWLKVHTALVHSCNSVICTWLDATGKMCQLQTDRHRPMRAGTMRGMLQSPSHGCVCCGGAQPQIHIERQRGEKTQGVPHNVMERGRCPDEALLGQ